MRDLKCLLIVVMALVAACSSPQKKESTETTTESRETTPEVAAATGDPVVGEKIYNQYCVVCHMKDGAGIPGLNPPLIKTEWVNGDKTQLIKIVLNHVL